MAITLASVGSGALNLGITLITIIIIGGVVLGVVLLLLRQKKYSEYKCVIWEKDGFGQLVQKIDSAGVFVDKKTKNKRFFMKRANVGLNPDNIPYISGRSKTVYLYRTGLKNFQFIKPVIKDNPGVSFSVGEEDVNWAINSYERQKKLFQNNVLLQYLPFIALAFVSIIILAIFIYFFKEFDTLKEVAVAMKESASILVAGG